MPRYDIPYDYGLRGAPRGQVGRRGRPAGAAARISGEPRERRRAPRGPRVTARYNRDYVFGGRGEEVYPRNYAPYAGDRPEQIVDEYGYRRPYQSIGGTRTFRGSPEPVRYGPDRYDDVDYHPFR